MEERSEIKYQEENGNDYPDTCQHKATTHRLAAKHKETAEGQKCEGDSIKVSEPGPGFFRVVEVQEIHLAQNGSGNSTIVNNMAARQIDRNRTSFDKELQAVSVRPVAAFKLARFTEARKDHKRSCGIRRVADNRADIGFNPLYTVTRVPLFNMIDRHAGDGVEQGQADTEETDVTVQYVIPAPPAHA